MEYQYSLYVFIIIYLMYSNLRERLYLKTEYLLLYCVQFHSILKGTGLFGNLRSRE